MAQVIPKTTITDLKEFVKFMFQTKTPGSKVFVTMGGDVNGADFRKKFNMSDTCVEKWKTLDDKKSAPLRYPCCSKDIDLILDTLEDIQNSTGNINENAFMCMTASFMSAPKKNTDGNIIYRCAKTSKCVYAYHSIGIDIDYKDLPESIKTMVNNDANKLWEFFRNKNIDSNFIPYPSAVVSSGRGGLHIYWVLDKKIMVPNADKNPKRKHQIADYAAFLNLVKRAFLADPKVTPVQWMRLPGTINYKDKPLPCELLELSGCVDSIDELKKYIDIANSDLKAYPLYDYIMELNSDALDKKIQSIHIPDNANSILIAEEYNAICNEYGYPIPNTDKNGLIFEDISSEFENDNETIVYENSTDNVIDMSNIENFTMSNTTKVINRDLIYSGRQCTNEWIYFSAADFPKMIDYNEVKTAHYVTARDLTEILINRRDFRDSGRNTYLFYIGVNIAFSLVGKEEHVIYNEVRDTLININNRLHNPLSDNEIICICNSIKRQYISFYCSTDISITKKGFTICPEEMLLSSDTLCRILNITDKDFTYTRQLMTAN